MLSGKEEAERFDKKQHGDIRRSIVEKAMMIAFLGQKLIDGSLETKGAGPYVRFASASIDSVQTALELGARFHLVSRQLARRHDGRATLIVQDEYDAQDLFHALLRISLATCDVRNGRRAARVLQNAWTSSFPSTDSLSNSNSRASP